MGKIRDTLELIRRRLNEFMRSGIGGRKEWVILSNIVDLDGRSHDEAKNQVVMFLANMQNETTISTYNRNVPARDNQYVLVAPPLYIDLYLMFYANFCDKNYPDGLDAITQVISFFQQNPWFNHENLPGLDPTIEKLTFEFTNLDLMQLHYLIGLAGVKYLPLTYYKVRMIPFQGEAVQGTVPAAQGVQTPGEAPAEKIVPVGAARSAARTGPAGSGHGA